MDERNKLVLKALLTRLSDEQRRLLESFIPESEKELISNLPSFDKETESTDFSNRSFLDKVHWSWLLPTLKSYKAKEQQLFISVLTSHAQDELRKILKLKTSSPDVTELGKGYVQNLLLESLVGPTSKILDPEFFPSSPLNRLCKITKKQLVQLINHLALYDLAFELRQIVETKILKKLYSLLTDEQKKILSKLTAHTDPTHLPKLGLDRWDGTEETLKILLHRRGISRLGIALSGQNEDLIWTICHHLDIGRGSALLKACAKEAISGLSDVIIKQIEELL